MRSPVVHRSDHFDEQDKPLHAVARQWFEDGFEMDLRQIPKGLGARIGQGSNSQ